MHENSKVQESTYFLQRMVASHSNHEAFKYNLSAFLSAARSVAQYARKEAATRPGGQAWYDRFVGAHPLMRFFASERDANTHDAPSSPAEYVDVYARDAGILRDTEHLETFDTEGNLVQEVEFPPPLPGESVNPAPEFRFELVYRFAGWEGPEDVVTLSSAYLKDLHSLVEDGSALRLLSS